MQPATQKLYVEDAWQTPRNARTLRAFMALQNEEIAQRLVALREAKGKPPQTAVAAALGVGERTVQSWEQGEAKPGYRSLQKLAAYYGVGEDFILTGQPQRETPDLSIVKSDDDLSRIAARLEKLEIAVHEQNDLLARQSRLLAKIEGLVRVLEGVDVVSESAGDGAADLGKPAAAPEGLGLDVRNQQPSPRRRRAKDAQSRDRRRDVS